MTLGRYDGAVSPSFLEGLTLEGPIGHSGRVILAIFYRRNRGPQPIFHSRHVKLCFQSKMAKHIQQEKEEKDKHSFNKKCIKEEKAVKNGK